MKKIGLLFDERLSHDRKNVFLRNMTTFKVKYSIDFLPQGFDENSFIEFLDKTDYSVVMIPWHLYFSWKKAANLAETRVMGYFADPLLQFEFQSVPNYQNFTLLDFYHFDLDEMEILFKLMAAKSIDTELVEIFGKIAHYSSAEWFEIDHESSTCIDLVFENPIFQSNAFQERIPNLRLYVTALWLSCFQEKRIVPSEAATAKLFIGEFKKRLMIQLTYQSPSLTSKDILQELWPTGNHKSILFQELSRHSDFLKVFHFPMTRKISISALFLPSQPSLAQNGEVRGFWVENRL
jgi:hypothetical protein